MPQVCTVCTHADCSAINAALVSGEPKRAIAARFGLSASAVKRHARDHVPRALVLAREAGELREHVEVDVEKRQYVATWGTPDGTLGPAAHRQTDVKAYVPALPLAQGNGTKVD